MSPCGTKLPKPMRRVCPLLPKPTLHSQRIGSVRLPLPALPDRLPASRSGYLTPQGGGRPSRPASIVLSSYGRGHGPNGQRGGGANATTRVHHAHWRRGGMVVRREGGAGSQG